MLHVIHIKDAHKKKTKNKLLLIYRYRTFTHVSDVLLLINKIINVLVNTRQTVLFETSCVVTGNVHQQQHLGYYLFVRGFNLMNFFYRFNGNKN